MKFDKIHNKGPARLFESPVLEMLTKANPIVIWSIYLPLIIGLPVYAYHQFGFSGGRIALLFFSGMFFWTLFEYLAHRYLFHWIAESKRAQKFVYIMHGNHHHYPRDRERLFMPPVSSLMVAIVTFALQFLLLRNQTFVFFPGYALGYLLYASMRYAIHAFNPPFKWMKPLWRNHHLHHYKDEHKGFGVSSTLWDHVFGTMIDLKKEKEDKQKVQELMFNNK